MSFGTVHTFSCIHDLFLFNRSVEHVTMEQVIKLIEVLNTNKKLSLSVNCYEKNIFSTEKL